MKDLIKHIEVYRGLIKSSLSLIEFWVPQSTRFLKTKIKGELLQSVFHFHRLVAGKQWGKSKKLWFQFFFFFFPFYFGFCFEFLIELLKKIEALLFFEIGLCLWVCLYLLWNRIMFPGLFIFDEVQMFTLFHTGGRICFWFWIMNLASKASLLIWVWN